MPIFLPLIKPSVFNAKGEADLNLRIMVSLLVMHRIYLVIPRKLSKVI